MFKNFFRLKSAQGQSSFAYTKIEERVLQSLINNPTAWVLDQGIIDKLIHQDTKITIDIHNNGDGPIYIDKPVTFRFRDIGRVRKIVKEWLDDSKNRELLKLTERLLPENRFIEKL